MLDRIPTEGTDRAVAAIARMSVMMITVEAAFDHRLDAGRLARAVALTLDAEPVLGCRFVPDDRRPYWERLDRTALEVFAESADRAAFDRFLAEPLVAERGPQLQVRLLHEADGDRVRVKLGHLAADAGGAKEAVERLASIYTRLAAEPRFVPEPNARGSRGTGQVMRHVPLRIRPRILARQVRAQVTTFGFPGPAHLGLPAVPPRGPPHFVLRHLDRDRVGPLAAYGRERHATLNDLAVTAFLRAVSVLATRGRPAHLRLLTTADLRRYLPNGRAAGICNLSGFELLGLGVTADRDECFDTLLDRVSREMRRRKAAGIGLCDYITLMPVVSRLPFRWIDGIVASAIAAGTRAGRIPPALTNMGPIRTEQVRFDHPARDAWIVVPPAYPPYVIAGLSGYEGSLTVSIGWFPESLPHAPLERLLDLMLLELPR